MLNHQAAVNGSHVSVVIPAFNAATHLDATLESVFAQSMVPGEVIVVDDGSTDDTVAIAQASGARVISLPNQGPSAARNAGTQVASGEYVAYLDADDLWAPEKLALQLAALDNIGQPAFSFTDYRLFDGNGLFARKSELRHRAAFRRVARVSADNKDMFVIRSTPGRATLYESYVMPSSIVVRRVDALAIGGYDETLRITEDYEFCLRLLNIVPAVVVMKPLLFYRRHAIQATANGPRMMAGYFAVAQRVAQSPERYASGDVSFITTTEHVREHRLGLQQSRVGQLDAAVGSFRRGLAARWTLKTYSLLIVAEICRSVLGRFIFDNIRALWKRRPGHR